MNARIPLLILVTWALCATGCSPSTATVEGTASYKGQAVERGSIDLVPTEGTEGTAARAVIEGGAFKIAGPMAPGKYLVQVRWPKATGKKIKVEADAPGAVNGEVDEMKQVIPPEFNEKSTLKRDITAGRNTLKLEL